MILFIQKYLSSTHCVIYLPIHQGHVYVCVYLDVSVVVCREIELALLPQIHYSCQFKGITFMMITRDVSGSDFSKLLAKILGPAAAPSTHTHTHAHFLKYSENDPILGIYRNILKERFGFSQGREIGSVSQVYLYI